MEGGRPPDPKEAEGGFARRSGGGLGVAPPLERKGRMTKITKDMIIADILQVDMGIAQILLKAGMHCVGCPAATGESLEEAGVVHGIDVDSMVDEINAYLASQKA